MEAKLSTNRKFRRTFAKVLSILAILAIAFPVTGSAVAQGPDPRIVASITYNWFQAEYFLPGASLTLEVFDAPGGTLLWGDNRTTDALGFVSVEEWEHSVDLIAGNAIVVSDGVATKELELEAVTLDVFDPSSDYLAGTAPPATGGRLVWVGTGNASSGCGMDLMADAVSGAWEADFSTQPCDVTEDMWAAAQVFDTDGDASEANPPPPPPNPRFVVFPEWEWFDGLDWPDGATVTITVEGKPECETETVSSESFFNGSFGEGCDIVTGDTVTFTDGVTIRTHTVRNLTVSDVDKEANTVAGTADAGEVVYVWPHATGQQLQATAEDAGTWQVDFTGLFDLVEGEGGRSEVRDEAGNSTAVDWRIPNPHFSAFPEWESIEGWEWPEGAVVHLTIEDPATSQSPRRRRTSA